MVLIKVLLLFCYCVSCKSVLLSLAPLSLGQYIKTNPTNKRKRTEKIPKPYKRKRTEKKKHKCDECSKTFLTPNDLLRHTRTHTGERPFKCDVCSMEFTYPYGLRRHNGIHNRIHTRDQPYQCEFCPTKFTKQNNYLRHKKAQHDNKKPHVPQEKTQAGQESNSTIMETPSEWDLHDIEEVFDPSDQGELSPFDLRDNNKPDVPQKATQAEQEWKFHLSWNAGSIILIKEYFFLLISARIINLMFHRWKINLSWL